LEDLHRHALALGHTPTRGCVRADLVDDPDRLVARHEREAAVELTGVLLVVGAAEAARLDAQQRVVDTDARPRKPSFDEVSGLGEHERPCVVHAVVIVALPRRYRPPMPDAVDRLLALLDLERVASDRFRTENPDPGYGKRVFGGQVAAQAIRAAVDTVEPDRSPHSLHAYFIRPGRPGVPIDFDLARQLGEVIFEMSTSLHVTEPGVDYQMPLRDDVPQPAEVSDRVSFVPDEARDRLPIEMREVGASEPDDQGWYPSTRRVWMRVKRGLPDDALLHACVLTFLSDMGAVMGARAPLEEQPLARLMGASLDHALWFHRPIRADEWFLYDLHAVSNAGARGLTRGTMHAIDGVLGVSVAQEALLRVV
jgi:acyl-CoA thioesterase-2